jgi:EmrB/QacA subfamily drug resistance transporter
MSQTDTGKLDPRLIRLGLVLVPGIVMSMLDSTIVNIALDTLGRGFHAGLATIQWVVIGYLLAMAITLPTAGWATDRFGGRREFIAATVMFTVGSGLCAVSWDAGSLIAFRLVQGAAGALLMPVAQTMLARAAGSAAMGRVMAIVGVPALLAPVAGPIIGGAIVDDTTWRWIFLINLPIGVFSLLLSLRALPRDQAGEQAPSRLDVRGLALLSPGLALLVYGLSHAGAVGSFADTAVWATMAGGLALIVAFVLHARAWQERALIPLAFFRDRAFTGSAVVSMVIGMCVFGVMLLLPLYYQQVRGDDALRAGLMLIPQELGVMVMLPVSGVLTDRLGPRTLVTAGMAAVVIGTLPLTRVTASTADWQLIVTMVLRGLGFGAAMMPAIAGGYRNLPAAAAARASTGLSIFSRIGGTLGGAILAVILATHLAVGNPAGGYDAAFSAALAIAAAGFLAAFLLPGKPPGPEHDLERAGQPVGTGRVRR